MSDPVRASNPTETTQVPAPATFGRAEAGEPTAETRIGVGDPQFAPRRTAGEEGRLGRFRVLRKVGRGGMGAVYLGYDETLERTVALKVMLPAQAADPVARERFLREARSAAKIKSDHVVTIFDVGEEDGHPFIAMEHLIGASLERYLTAQGELPLPQILRVAREAALGLAAAHELGLVHRDIKPANLWLEAPHGRVKILDFGLARAETENVNLTDSGIVVGTPAYMSPEQGRGHAVDHRSDLFSLGAVLYRLCTGKLPFNGDSAMAILCSLALDTPTPVRQIDPNLPEALEAIIARLLVKNPDGRFQTAREVAEALRAAEQLVSGPAVVPLPFRVKPQADTTNVWEGIATTENGTAATATESPTAPGSPSAPAPGVRHPRRPPGSRLRPALLVVATLLAAAVLVGILLQISKGKLLVESDDPDAELVIKKDGAIVRDRTKEREIALRVGAYTVELADPKPGLRVAPEKVEITERKSAYVRVMLERPRPPVGKLPVAPPPPTSPDRKAAEYILSCGGTVTVGDPPVQVQAARDLPKDPFTLVGCYAAGGGVTDAGLEAFRDCSELRYLDLAATRVTDAGLAHFENCKKLTHLNLSGAKRVGDAGVGVFKDCTNLTNVSLPDTQVTDAGLAHLKDCTRIWELSLAGNRQITDAGLAHLKEWTNLRELFLDNTQVTDAGLEHLKWCKGIMDLNLTGTKVTDTGLAHFKECKNLRLLSVWKTEVTDAGLAHFKDSPRLAQLDVRQTRITAKMVAELSKALPRCRITWNGGVIEPKP